MRSSGNTILVTGGGSGIGRELAHRLHDAGNQVIVAGRRREPLEETAAGRDGISIDTVDVGDAASIEAFAGRVIAAHPTLNVLINNAGIMKRDDLTRKVDLADAEATIVTNLLGPIRMTNALVDHLKTQEGAAIVNVTSGLAFVPLVASPVYSATKAAIHSLSLSLRLQLEGKVEVIELAPPGVRTELTPGQSDRESYMPLDAFADEVTGLLLAQPTPQEAMVERVKGFRRAEAEGKTEQLARQMMAVVPPPGAE